MSHLSAAPVQSDTGVKDALVRRARPLMGTLVGVSARSDDACTVDGVIRSVFAEMERLEAILSEWRPDSAVSQVNQSAGTRPVQVPLELIEAL